MEQILHFSGLQGIVYTIVATTIAGNRFTGPLKKSSKSGTRRR